MNRRKWMAMVAVMAAVLVCGLWSMVSPSYGAALTAERDTPQRTGARYGFVQGSNVIYAGSMVAVWSNDLAQAAADTASLKVIGRAAKTQDNTGANYLSTRTIEVEAGIFRWENGPTFTDANVGDLAYVSDDQTVTSAGNVTYDVVAGVIVDVDDDGVWVDTHDIGSQGAASVTTWTASGAGSVGGTLSVAGAATLTGNAIANELDARTATALLLGKATATSVTLGAADANTSVAGALAVTGNTTGAGASFSGAVTGLTVQATSAWSGTVTNGVAGITNTFVVLGGVITTNVVSN